LASRNHEILHPESVSMDDFGDETRVIAGLPLPIGMGGQSPWHSTSASGGRMSRIFLVRELRRLIP
jgi:hypothetical protein